MDNHKVQRYLNRIGLTDCRSDFAGLVALQNNHMTSVPFENLDVVAGRDIHLDQQHLFRKVIEQRRGGYCFELNLLYAELLTALGFKPTPVLGRVWLRNPPQLPPRNHLTHLVDVDGTRFVTDVVFGGMAPRVPLDIHCSKEVQDIDGVVRVIPLGENQYMVQRKVGTDWANQYSFEDTPISIDDIEIANFYMSKNPQSHFYQHRFVGLFTESGRVGLFDNTLSHRQGIETLSTDTIEDGNAWLACLKSEFELELDFSGYELNRLFA